MRTSPRLVAVVAIAAAVATTSTAAAEAAPTITRNVRSVQTAAHINSIISDAKPTGTVFTGPDSVWKADVTRAPVNQNSTKLVANLAKQVATRYNGVAAFNVNNYGTSFYSVSPDQPRVQVKFDNCQKKNGTPKGLYGVGGQFENVPVPDDAVPASGSDAQLTIYSPATHELWEFWKAKRVNGQWQACWGGRIDDTTTSPGYFEKGFGASASGLSFSAGAVGIKDAQAGVIDHALSLQLVEVQHWKTFSWPAQRSDGYVKDVNAIPEGMRFRLDPSVNVDALKLTPIAKMVARAAQQYGFIVTDKSGAVAITAENSSAVKADTGVDPWPGLMQGKKSYQIMANFPWDKLQALPFDYGKPTS